MDTPTISVIVPVYNVDQYLSRCIDSILAQTFTDFELLLIDDGSPDNSGKICDEYAEKDSRIRVFHKENGGVSSARNVGLDNARGEWVYFSDADDIIKTDGLQLLFDGVKEGVRFIMAGYEIYDETGSFVYGCKKYISQIVTSNDCLLYMFKPIDYSYHGYLWCKLFHTQIIRDAALRFDKDISFNEDRLFIVQYLCVNKAKCFYTTVPVYNYYIRENSAMASLRQGFNYKFVSDLKAFELMLDSVKRIKDEKCLYWNRRSLYYSHLKIRRMMKTYDVKDKSLKKNINIILKNNVPYILRLYFYLQRAIAYIKKTIKNIIK